MTYKIDYQGKEIELSETASKTPEQVEEEIMKLGQALIAYNPLMALTIKIQLSAMMELMHWIYDASGEHDSPSKIISQYLEDRNALKEIDASGEPPKFDA